MLNIRVCFSRLAITLVLCGISSPAFVEGQVTVFSRSEYSGGLWWDDGSVKPWFYAGEDRNRVDNNIGGNTRHNVEFGHNVQTTNTINGAFFGLRSLTMKGTASANRTFNVSDGGGISLSVGYTGETGTGAHTFNNQFGIDGPTVTFTNDGGLFTATNTIFVNNNTLAFSGNGNFSITGVMEGNGGNVIKSGGGTLTLSAANTYTGNTTVNGGKLIVSSGGAINSPAATVAVNGGELQVDGNVTANSVTIGSGATLSGTGSIGTGSNSTSVVVNGTLAPGNSIGNLTVNGGLSLAGTYSWEVNHAMGGSADLVDVNGTLTLSNATLSILETGSFVPNTKFTLFAYNGPALTSGFTGWVNLSTVGNWRINYGDNTAGVNGGSGNFYVTLTAVPEPTSLLFVGLPVAAGLIRRRRKN